MDVEKMAQLRNGEPQRSGPSNLSLLRRATLFVAVVVALLGIVQAGLSIRSLLQAQGVATGAVPGGEIVINLETFIEIPPGGRRDLG